MGFSHNFHKMLSHIWVHVHAHYIVLCYIWYWLFAISKSSFVGRSTVIIRLSYTSANTLACFFFLIRILCNIKSIAHTISFQMFMYIFSLLCCYTCGMSLKLWHSTIPSTRSINTSYLFFIFYFFFCLFISAFHLVHKVIHKTHCIE